MSDPYDLQGNCDVCGANGKIGVFGSSIAPASFAYCPECSARRAEPFMVVAAKIYNLGGLQSEYLDELADVVTFDDGKYVGLPAVLKEYPDLEGGIRADFSPCFD